MMFVSPFVLIVVFSLILCVHDDISELCLIVCRMTALLLHDCVPLVYGLARGYTDVWEHSGGERRIVVDWSPIIEDLYSPELGSACVDVMSTLHGSAPSFLRCAEGCVPLEGSQFRSQLSLESHSWRRVGGRLIRADSYSSSDSSVEMSDELASTLASIQEFMAGVSRHLDQIESSRQDPQPVGMVIDETVPHASQTAQAIPPRVSLEAKVERLESMMRQIRLQDGDPLEAIQHGHESTWIDDAQLVALFPMSLSGAAQRWFASVESSRLRTWEDVAREFLTQFAFSADIDVSRRELEATRQRPEESISSFVTRWRAKVAGMVDRPKEQDQIDMVLRNLQPRFARRLVGIPFQDLRSLVQATFSVEEAIARGLWTDTTLSPDKPLLHPPPRPYAQRPARQFTPLGMTLTRAFEKLRDAGVIVPLAPRPLPHHVPLHFRLHEHCLYHQILGHDTEHCSALHHAIQDLIDSGMVDLVRPSVTPIPCLHILHMQFLLLLVFSRLIWILRVLMAYGVMGPSRMRTWGQSAWVHHLVAVQFRAFLILIMVIIRLISILLSPVFSSSELFLFC
ncbi:hypothetical protein CK203_064371 [Vitis vinifera]|uniref:Retrotransposon gag domain-containing protein n=1 Tax=Vitis vinifera TaxID=29760 RepID=A0A438G6Y3_VITVI|nr:hypothetical protein CK203_064371 [Vitis vinifera]